MKIVRVVLAVVAIAAVAIAALAAVRGGPRAQQSSPRTHLVIVFDGLRPDYVTADVMPGLPVWGSGASCSTPITPCFRP